jgi:hypothetical protein
LKLPHELPLQRGQKVTITVHPTASTTHRRRGLIQWKGSQQDLDHLILSADNEGYLTILDRPGLSIEINREALKRFGM